MCPSESGSLVVSHDGSHWNPKTRTEVVIMEFLKNKGWSCHFLVAYVSHDHSFCRGTAHRQKLNSLGELTEMTMKAKERAQDVQDAVEEDFTLHYRVTDKTRQVEAITVNMILKIKTTNSEIDGFPEPTPRESESREKKLQENSLYGPFTTTTEAIWKVVKQVLLTRRWAVRNG